MAWKEALRGDSLSWLLEEDVDQPGVRYFALRDLVGHSEDEAVVRKARKAVMTNGPVPKILAAQQPEGYWEKPGHGYGPKYRGTVWQITFLAQLGADGHNQRVKNGCEYVLGHSVASHGGFSATKTPSGFIHCLNGNLGAALIDLGWIDDPRLRGALEWQAQTITGKGVAPAENTGADRRYYKSGTSGPTFACAANDGLSCAWGGVKAMLALGKVPASKRTPVIKAAVKQGVEFLLSRDPAVADYPAGYSDKPSTSWFKFGYPIGYVTDVLQNLEALALVGEGQNPKLHNAIEFVLSKQDAEGRWPMEYGYSGKMWVDIESKRKPSKWVTLRALRVLKAAGAA